MTITLLEKATAEELEALQNHIWNYFVNINKAKTKDVLLSTFKELFEDWTGKGKRLRRYRNSFVAINAKATNEYKDRTVIAHIANRFQNPCISGFFRELGVTVDEDKLALAELVQCIWRSAIREGKEIQLYIPSKRMRGLLQDWLDKGA